jgi:ATP-binding cassette, subfamily B, bacterial
MPPSATASLLRVREYLWPYRRRAAGMVALGLGMVTAGVTIPLVIRQVIDGPLRQGDGTALLELAGLSLLLGSLDAGFACWRRWLSSRVVLDLERDIRNDLYRHLQRLPISFHDRWLAGQLLSRITSDLSTVRRFTSFGMVFLVLNLALFAGVCTLLIRIDLLLGLVTAGCLVPVGFECARFERRFTRVSRLVQDQSGDLASIAEESATGIRVIKAFGRRQLLADRYRGQAEAVYANQLEKVRLRANLIAYLDINPNVLLALLLLLGAVAVGQHRLTLGDLVAFVTLALQLVWPIEALGFIIASAQEAGTAAQRIYEVLDTRPTITDPPHPAAAEPAARARGGQIRYEAVSFTFPGSERPALQDISLTIEAGETIAVVGASGSGKTALAMLVPRLADPSAGRVLLDGVDLRDLPVTQVRGRIATAFEDPVLFSASVRENVTLGRPGATDEEVWAALALAQAQFVEDLPWRLDTRIGEQGLALSGGQRQRLALARAVLGRPQVLVLDDPLSALDVATEARVEQALRVVLAGTTALVVVHRPSTITLADRVAVLDGGRLIAVGSHAELLAGEPRYAELLGLVPA